MCPERRLTYDDFHEMKYLRVPGICVRQRASDFPGFHVCLDLHCCVRVAASHASLQQIVQPKKHVPIDSLSLEQQRAANVCPRGPDALKFGPDLILGRAAAQERASLSFAHLMQRLSRTAGVLVRPQPSSSAMLIVLRGAVPPLGVLPCAPHANLRRGATPRGPRTRTHRTPPPYGPKSAGVAHAVSQRSTASSPSFAAPAPDCSGVGAQGHLGAGHLGAGLGGRQGRHACSQSEVEALGRGVTPIAVQFVWAFVLGAGMALLPESPRFLLHRNREDAARRALARLASRPADSPEVAAELHEIRLALEDERAIGGSSYMDCFRNTELKNGLRTWTGIMLQGWQQLTGINFIFYYGTTFFISAGFKNAFIITVITDVVNTVMTIVGIQLIDRVGRRRLLIIGAVGMAVCEFIVAIVGVTAGKLVGEVAINTVAQRVLIAFVCFYIAFFATSWGPVAWVVTGEIFPLNIRAKGMSLAVASNWLWNFGIAYATPYLVDPSSKGQPNGVATAALHVKVFFIWGSTCLGCLVFAYFFIPETKGLSLEQIDLLYKESTIRTSDKYRKQMLAGDVTFSHHEKATPRDDSSEEKV
ncbi:hypothetical protein GGX14DRAFT_397587 [Mycena pura]|uniref:Major facilitator superfamily (MFS) profile domain-containing protein n=1 Tax=Mycena pura TaxID=153505 RepID=A0AAD6Y8J3_9AGAR|nr:hypothetical protein GGX14DRAFT_397587 [Mycena pura]